MKFLIRIIALLFVASAQPAFAAGSGYPWLDEVRAGASTVPNGELQILFSPIPTIGRPYDRTFAWLFTPRPMVGVSVSLTGKTSDAYAGLTWTVPLHGRFFAELSAGGLVHDQNLNQSYTDRPSPLSTRFLFRESIAIGYKIDEYWRIVAFADHGSNGDLGYRNEALNHYGLMVGRKFAPDQPTPKLDPYLFAFHWNGPHVGFQIGLAHSNYGFVWPTPSDVTSTYNSVLLGLQAGYDVMFGSVLVGGEVDWGVQGLHGSALVPPDSAYSASSFWVVTTRGRVGTEVAIPYLSKRSLIYATGGAAFSRIANGFCPNASVQCFLRPSIDIGGGWTDQGHVRTGWTAGAGVEVPLARAITGKIEYLYVDFGNIEFNNGPVPNTITFNEHILRTGLNYKFQ